MREIVFYETASGQRPIEDFLDRLSSKQTQKVTWVLQLIEEIDRVPINHFKRLVNTADLWEVKVTVGSNIFRLLGFFNGMNIVVLTHAFQKNTQKTPREAIEIAEERKKDYFRRKQKCVIFKNILKTVRLEIQNLHWSTITDTNSSKLVCF